MTETDTAATDPYKVTIARKAAKALAKLDRPHRVKMVAAIDGLAANPRPANVAMLHGDLAGYLRIKLGDSLRIVYLVDDDARTVTVTMLGQRENLYD